MKPQVYEAATELGDRKPFTSPPQIQERPKPKAFTQILRLKTVEVPQVQLEPILVTPSRTERQCHQ